ncbi:hypothetical protein [Streptomyces sp. XD-27]|uniref:hypothetical protein n=1 Tax=Streptomyces sp. XD-27 TaxID=3062779 RepID=UPI0026F41541|nr:hypothetical protein [Streptomyces sp. XD-27]WKX70179.1 hypothetical protein Q3Y56_09840 [Streptomyces sp. XD-27]
MKWQITLTSEEFATVFQVTVQLYELEESSLLERGCSPEDLGILLSEIRSARAVLRGARLAGSSGAVIRTAKDGEPEPRTAVSVYAAEGNQAAVSFEIPERIAREWPSLLLFAQSAFGEKELYYRTGYRADEVQKAVDALRLH